MEVFNFLVDIPLEDKHNWNFILKKGYQFVKWDKKETFNKDKKNYYYKNKIAEYFKLLNLPNK